MTKPEQGQNLEQQPKPVAEKKGLWARMREFLGGNKENVEALASEVEAGNVSVDQVVEEAQKEVTTKSQETIADIGSMEDSLKNEAPDDMAVGELEILIADEESATVGAQKDIGGEGDEEKEPKSEDERRDEIREQLFRDDNVGEGFRAESLSRYVGDVYKESHKSEGTAQAIELMKGFVSSATSSIKENRIDVPVEQVESLAKDFGQISKELNDGRGSSKSLEASRKILDNFLLGRLEHFVSTLDKRIESARQKLHNEKMPAHVIAQFEAETKHLKASVNYDIEDAKNRFSNASNLTEVCLSVGNGIEKQARMVLGPRSNDANPFSADAY